MSRTLSALRASTTSWFLPLIVNFSLFVYPLILQNRSGWVQLSCYTDLCSVRCYLRPADQKGYFTSQHLGGHSGTLSRLSLFYQFKLVSTIIRSFPCPDYGWLPWTHHCSRQDSCQQSMPQLQANSQCWKSTVLVLWTAHSVQTWLCLLTMICWSTHSSSGWLRPHPLWAYWCQG